MIKIIPLCKGNNHIKSRASLCYLLCKRIFLVRFFSVVIRNNYYMKGATSEIIYPLTGSWNCITINFDWIQTYGLLPDAKPELLPLNPVPIPPPLIINQAKHTHRLPGSLSLWSESPKATAGAQPTNCNIRKHMSKSLPFSSPAGPCHKHPDRTLLFALWAVELWLKSITFIMWGGYWTFYLFSIWHPKYYFWLHSSRTRKLSNPCLLYARTSSQIDFPPFFNFF